MNDRGLGRGTLDVAMEPPTIGARRYRELACPRQAWTRHLPDQAGAARVSSARPRQASGFFDDVSRYFERAARYTEFSPGLLEQVRACNGVYRIRFPVERDDGEIEVRGSLSRGAQPPPGSRTKGGIRFSPDVNQDEVPWPSRRS